MTSCQKQPYPDQGTARLALASIRKQSSPTTPKTPRRVYPCDKCEGWHLTSKPLSGKIPEWDRDPAWTRPNAAPPQQDLQTARCRKQDRLVQALAREYEQLTEDGRVEFALSAPDTVYRAFGALMAHARKTRKE